MKMFINIHRFIDKNTFISCNNNNLQQTGYALELPPNNII